MKLTPKRKVAMPIGTRASKADQRGRLVVEAMRRAPKPKRGMSTDQLMAFTRGE